MTAPKTAAPPRLAELLLRLAAPSAERPFVLGDFRDAFEDRIATVGTSKARAWYWRETFRSLVPLAVRGWQASRSRRPRQRQPVGWAHVALVDVRYALRLSGRSPLASLAIVTTMALGIAATTAVFSATNAVLLRPLPFAASDRVVQMNGVLRGGQRIESLAYPDLMDFRRTVPDFADLTVFQRNDVTLQHGTDPQLLRALQVDDAYNRVFGLRAALGRLLGPGDAVLNTARVAVLTHDLWMREFGGDRSIVGSMITLDNAPAQVVGVLSSDAYIYPRASVDLLTPLVILPNTMMTNRGAMWASAAAKLKPGASLAQTARDVTAAAKVIEQNFPAANKGITARVTSLQEAVVGSVQSMLELLAAAVAAVLLIACTNIANLILGRAQARSREFAVRSALGGSPSRVRRQVLTESLVLAAVGGAGGVALAPLLTHSLIAMYPDALPRAEEIGISSSVVLVAVLATLAAGLLSAFPTARRIARLDLADDLRDGGRSGGGRRDRRAGRVLVVTQVAASLALLFSAGLLLQTFRRLTHVKPGFEPRGALAFHVFVPSARYKTTEDIDRYYDDAAVALRTIPGVRDVSTTTLLPFGGSRFYDVFVQEERGDQGPNNPATAVSVSTPEFDRALGIPLLRGRSFTRMDDSTSEPVVMINEVIAKRNYPGQDPIGHVIKWNAKDHWRIIGVVGSIHLNSLSDELMPILYAPESQATRRSRYFIVRADASADQVLPAARAIFRRLDPTIALTDVATMDRRIQSSLGAQRFRATLMATLGALALVLAVIGIYSVVAYSVSRRTREIGIRMALGEGQAGVRRRVVADALRGASAGLTIGVVLALASGKWLTVFLVDVSPYDGTMLATAVGLLAAVVAAAAYGPARRAARVDPVAALRAD